MKSSENINNVTINDRLVYSPCRYECPVNTDVQRYIFLISNKRYEEAFEVIRAVNPLPSTCSYICHHPCEKACRRGRIDDPLAIRHLKRFATEKVTDYRRKKRIPVSNTIDKKVAVVGSGPSGLTIASDLADLGYGITIFEKGDKLGGILASAIPLFRLPREALQDDIDDIISKGIEVVNRCEIGKDITLNELVNRYDSVVIATGLSKSRSLDIPDIAGDDVFLALPFLIDVFGDKDIKIGKRVVVIGGGNVAMDVARTSKRLGSDVEIVCLEGSEEMPAWPWEIQEAHEEDIKIHHRWAPKRVIRENAILKGLEVMRVRSVFDHHGRFNPIYDKDETSFITCDTLIVSIGQKMDTTFLNQSPLISDDKGNLIFDKTNFMSNHPKIYYAGEIVTGPGSAISAIAHGHRVSHIIHLHLSSVISDRNAGEQMYESIGDIPETIKDNISPKQRVSIKLLDATSRKKTFMPVEMGYDDDSALKESKRCRGCGGGAVVDIKKCMACLTCKRVCPYDAPVVTSYSRIRQDYCQACGLCVSTCPGKAISMKGYDIQSIRSNVIDTLSLMSSGFSKPTTILFSCISSQGYLDYQASKDIHVVSVDCLSRLDVLDIITPFGYGVDEVLLIGCGMNDCKYNNIDYWLMMKVIHARSIMSSLSISPKQIRLLLNNTSETSSVLNYDVVDYVNLKTQT